MAVSRNRQFTDSILEAVATCLSRYTDKQGSIVVGYSGGMDSTVLLHAARRVAGEFGIHISALHVHHGLSIHADDWADACDETCTGLGIELSILRVSVPEGMGEGREAAARRVRHAALQNYPADWILLAHHAEDQAETLLCNLLRGAGVSGAAAMPELRGRVLRPFLGLSRGTLREYALLNGLYWSEDESNSDIRFTRNYFRSEVMPVIAARFPSGSENLAAAARHFREAYSLLEELATLDLDDNRPEFPLPLKVIRTLSAHRAKNLLRAMLRWHNVQSPDEPRLNEFVRQLQTCGPDRTPRLDLPRYSLWCKAGHLYFKNRD